MTKIELDLVPFTVPDFVCIKMPPRPREEGICELPKVRLSDLSSDALSRLCDEFKTEVFKKAGLECIKVDHTENIMRRTALINEICDGGCTTSIISWLKENCEVSGNITINDGLVNVDGDVRIINEITGIPVKFGIIKGYFDCSSNKLTSLEGAPKLVGGNFNCSGNQLTSLEGAPDKIDGNFYCYNNQLTSLKGALKKVSGFYCHDNQLTSLEGAPKEVGGNFWCQNNQLTSLKGAPKEVGGDFNCSNNQLTSLEGAPKEVGGFFDCSNNKLSSFKGAPKQINCYFNCSNNKLTSIDGAPKIVGNLISDSCSEIFVFTSRSGKRDYEIIDKSKQSLTS